MDSSPATPDAARMAALTRPHPRLLWLYAWRSLAGLFLQPLVFLPLFFRFHTLRYRFEAQGVHVAWGLLFRREVYVAYGRIQDLHLTRGLLERWLGLGTVEVQTASGSAKAEVRLEGLEDCEAVRDFLYQRLGEARGEGPAGQGTGRSEVVALLEGMRQDVAAVRAALAPKGDARG